MAVRFSPKMPRARAEPTIALINIVFLMLIFFLIAGTLASPIDRDLKLAKVSELKGAEPPDALLVFPDMRLSYRNEDTSVDDYLALKRDQLLDTAFVEDENALVIRIVPDRDLPARDLVSVANELRAKGVAKVIVVTEREQQ